MGYTGGHQRIDARSVAMHRAIAEKLRSQPALLEIAKDNLNRWQHEVGRSRPYLDEWKRILEGPMEDVLTIIVDEGERMTALRQSSPFAGILDPRERWAIYYEFEDAGKAANAPSKQMTRAQLEHVVRASAAITGTEDIVVIGSQAVLGTFPDAPVELLVSLEADVFPLEHPDWGDLIDGSIGEGSPFQRSFGYFAHGVDETTAILPAGWKNRLVLVTGENTRDARGWCLEVHDLAIAKYAAGSEKDLDYTRSLARHGMTKRAVLLERLNVTELDRPRRDLAMVRIESDFYQQVIR